MSSASPDFLAIGHVAKDVSPEGFRLGGTVIFGALAALNLGLDPAVVTSVGPDLEIGAVLPGIPATVVPSPETTVFRNTYASGRRTQHLESTASRITHDDVPQGWREAPMVLLGPLVGEVTEELARQFPGSLVVASIQGWLRQWGADGLVAPKRWKGERVLPYVDAAVFGEDDIADATLIEAWAEVSRVLIVTMGAGGSRLYWRGSWHEIAPFDATEVDPTGAGDVYAAAYLARLGETGEPLEAARFASGAASFCVEADGADGLATRAQVEERLKSL